MQRRKFIRQTLTTASSIALVQPKALDYLEKELSQFERTGNLEELARDERFWLPVQRMFRPSPHFINLENGYFSPMPLETQQAWINNIEEINRLHTFYMRRRQFSEREGIRSLLAEFAGVSPDEIALVRNTTEALDNLIMGLPLQKGDEFIISDQDYPNMVEAVHMRAKREGIVVKTVSLPLHPKTDEEILQTYQQAITKRTKAMLVTHVINLTGQVLPVRQLCELGKQRQIEVIVDGAHAFGQLHFKIPDLNCDYYGTSLHKWLCAPLGSGMLYIRKEKIANIWPLFGDVSTGEHNIRKFERNGTQPCSNHLAIADALRFHHLIGGQLKEARLRYLCHYWAEKAATMPHLTLNMPLEKQRSCALGNVAAKGMTPTQLADFLYDKHKIFTVAIDTPAVKGVRITPHLYTTIADLDKLVAALKSLA
ncbi:MAG: aminotransferase class V-fold PLP-dependent enzyme [Cytophagales bacterium]|nr:aminotransferase class V-fold PLP-dependent enzyme [Bernardetiaceae bacterium]MDW8205127.1 aminotransferase class V-fold PLP-dependent enzyme [Cytophagales bacterium]